MVVVVVVVVVVGGGGGGGGGGSGGGGGIPVNVAATLHRVRDAAATERDCMHASACRTLASTRVP